MKSSAKYATGYRQIDMQHQMIFTLSEDFQAALAAGAGERSYGELLRSLELYPRTHFGLEEACMHRSRCPAAQENMDAHTVFVALLAEFQQRYAANGFDPAEAAAVMVAIDRWLDEHICRIDVQLKRR